MNDAVTQAASGMTLWAALLNTQQQVADNVQHLFVNTATANAANCAVPLRALGTTGFYVLDIPNWIPPQAIEVAYRNQAGQTPAWTDTPVDSPPDPIPWTGGPIQPPNTVLTPVTFVFAWSATTGTGQPTPTDPAIGVDGTLATAVALGADITRADTGTIVVPQLNNGQPRYFTRIGVGQYAYTFNPPQAGLSYNTSVSLKPVGASTAVTIPLDTLITPATSYQSTVITPAAARLGLASIASSNGGCYQSLSVFQASSPVFGFTVSQNGTPANLASHTFTFSIFDEFANLQTQVVSTVSPAQFSLSTVNGPNDTVTVLLVPVNLSNPGTFRYTLRDTTTSMPIATGQLAVILAL